MTPRYYSARLVKGGPLVGVKLFFGPPIVGGEELDRSPRMQCLVSLDPDGCYVWQLAESGAPLDVHGHTLRDVRPIDEAEYRYLIEHRAWAAAHNRYHPAASPREAVDLRSMKSLF